MDTKPAWNFHPNPFYDLEKQINGNSLNFMKTFLKSIVLLFFILVSEEVFASVRGTPHTTAFGSIKFMIAIYKERHDGKLPTSWNEFIESGILSGLILDDARKYCDIENRYQFLDLKPIQIGNRMERILIMARQAGEEGDNSDAEDPARRKGRWLIVEASDGSIQTRKYPEVTLTYSFEKAGLNLADFTSAAPPLPKYSPPRKDPNLEGRALGGPENTINGRLHPDQMFLKRKRNSDFRLSKDGFDSKHSWWLTIWIAVGLVSIGILAFAWTLRKQFK